jgi:hypothetical protein
MIELISTFGILDWLFVIVCWFALILFIAQFVGINGKDDDE